MYQLLQNIKEKPLKPPFQILPHNEQFHDKAPKAAVDEELYTAIDSVMNGYMYLRPKETKTLISSMLKKVPKEADSRNPYVILSPREREVLRFLVRGYSLAETAKALTVSIKTVDTHKTRMMNKLNISKKSELIEYALEYRLLNDGQV
ncbi:hypothetical protein B5S25_13215 [Paenibacillus larvae subsp. pulvifaciens]|nr:hypothetical protein B5S25_13215 [Paenibacillus larvae subsp. pulvifaciens]